MNTLLQKLFAQYHISPKNQYDITQIYSLLPLHKKNNLIRNFASLASKLHQIEEDLQVERDILFGDIMNDLEQAVEGERRKRIIFSK